MSDRRRVIPLRKIDRLISELGKFMDAVDLADPRMGQDMATKGDDQTETVRNAATALGHALCWAAYRRNHRRDPRIPTMGTTCHRCQSPSTGDYCAACWKSALTEDHPHLQG